MTGLPGEVVLRPKSLKPEENLNWNLLQTGLRLKTRLGLYLVLTMAKKSIFKFFSQKIKPFPFLVRQSGAARLSW